MAEKQNCESSVLEEPSWKSGGKGVWRGFSKVQQTLLQAQMFPKHPQHIYFQGWDAEAVTPGGSTSSVISEYYHLFEKSCRTGPKSPHQLGFFSLSTSNLLGSFCTTNSALIAPPGIAHQALSPTWEDFVYFIYFMYMYFNFHHPKDGNYPT